MGPLIACLDACAVAYEALTRDEDLGPDTSTEAVEAARDALAHALMVVSGGVDTRTPDAQKVEHVYIDAIDAIADVIGLRDGDGRAVREPSVDLDKIPAGVLSVGRHAIAALACGVDVLDPKTPVDEDAFTLEEMLAKWAEGS